MKSLFNALFISVCCILMLTNCQFGVPAEDIALPALFSDHMVLQRDVNLKVWGKATPHGRVTVQFKNQRAEVDAGEDSSWVVTLAPEPAGGPYELTVSGQETITLSDVLVGEVWLASGQSNMEWPVRKSDNVSEVIEAATDKEVRLFTVGRAMAALPDDQIPAGGWEVAGPETIPKFSAVGYFFGQVLRDSLDVPVGLIHSSWGGTRAEAWTSGASLVNHPDYTEAVQTLQADSAGFEANKSFSDWIQAIEDNDLGYTNGSPTWAAADLDDTSWKEMSLPHLWEAEALPNYDGIVWFRRQFTLPPAWTKQDLTLALAKIDDIDKTWVNGVEVGTTNQYNLLRNYTVPTTALSAGENVISVRVLDTGGGGGIWGEAADMYVSPANESGKPISLAGIWKYSAAVDLKSDQIPPRPASRHHTPTVLYNAMIHPLVPYSLKGAIWYQGESNASRAYQYQTLFPALIEDWRKQWDTQIAFHFVQLANFQQLQEHPVEEETWPELREAQLMALDLPNTGMAVTIDIGEANDIHPTNKQDVGLRLALSALNITYGHSNTAAGPLYETFTIEGNEVRVQFKNAENGLKTQGNDQLKGFAIAGEDQVFYWGNAVIDQNEVIVSSSKVAIPVAVRYGWANNPVVNLYNSEGLPASPFRTDDWPGITVEVK